MGSLRRSRGDDGWAALGAALILFVVASVSAVDVQTQTEFVGPDFQSFYGASRGAGTRSDIYDLSQLSKVASEYGMGQPAPYIYPPVLAYLLQPMGRLKPARAQRLWSLVTALAFCAAALTATVAARRRASPSRGEPLSWSVAVTIAVCLALALNYHNVVQMGQVNLIVLALMSPAILSPDEAGMGAAFGLALAILIKASPALFLVMMLVQGRRRLVARTVLWMAAIAAGTLLLGARHAWIAYFRFLPKLAPGQDIPGLAPASAIWNFSLGGLFARVSDDPVTVRRLATASAGLLGLALLAVARRSRGRSEAGQRGLLLSGCALMIFASPLAYVHHAIFLFPALFCWLAAGRTDGRIAGAVALALGMIAATDLPGIYARLELSPAVWKWLSSINLYALITLYVLGLRQAMVSARLAREPRVISG